MSGQVAEWARVAMQWRLLLWWVSSTTLAMLYCEKMITKKFHTGRGRNAVLKIVKSMVRVPPTAIVPCSTWRDGEEGSDACWLR